MCLYTRTMGVNKLYLLLYVDDIIIAGNNKREILELRDALKQEFPITDLEKPRNFLGIKIEMQQDGIFLSQRVYMLTEAFQYDRMQAR